MSEKQEQTVECACRKALEIWKRHAEDPEEWDAINRALSTPCTPAPCPTCDSLRTELAAERQKVASLEKQLAAANLGWA